MPEVHVLRVFCGEDMTGGNHLGVFLDGAAIAGDRRQPTAYELGFAETVFVDDADSGAIRIFTPGTELPFAGHPAVGSAWLLREVGKPVGLLTCPAGELPVRHDAELTYVSARPAWSPPFDLAELDSAAAVDALDGPPPGYTNVCAWAWRDRDAGLVRQRVFADEFGIVEDEATGSAAVLLCGMLGRPLTISQGHGSAIVARPVAAGMVEIGGRVALEEVRPYE
jgi:predicted PhzF superfamily epimerase YddE/YHI9